MTFSVLSSQVYYEKTLQCSCGVTSFYRREKKKKKNNSVQNNSPGSDSNKEQYEAKILEMEINRAQTNHTVKLNGIPKNKQNDFKTHK